jgi:hypothetical protein
MGIRLVIRFGAFFEGFRVPKANQRLAVSGSHLMNKLQR